MTTSIPYHDEKLEQLLLEDETIDLEARHAQLTRPHKSQRKAPWIFGSLLLVIWILLHANLMCHPYKGFVGFDSLVKCEEIPPDWTDTVSSQKVPLEAHIMSKCPDARDCLQKLVVPAMERVSEKVDFKLSYIGRFDEKSDGVSCMHGPSECLGNMIQLCAARIYPDPKVYLGFANCLTANYSQIPDRDFVQSCAYEHGVEFERVNKCISDEGHGSELLRNSFLRSQENNVTKSCTVRLAGEVHCIRDGGKWYDCPGGSSVEDLVKDIEKLYQA